MGNVSVHFSNITLDGSQWKVYGLNVIMNEVDLMCGTMKVQGDKMKNHLPTVNITRSTFGQLSISDGCHVQISDFNFTTPLCKNTSISKCRLCVENSYVKFSYSEVRIMEKDFVDFLVARNSHVSVEETLFLCVAEHVRTIRVQGGRLLLKKVVFEEISTDKLIILQLNVLATIQDTKFINVYGKIYALNKVDLSMLACRFYYNRYDYARFYVAESRLSIHDSLLDHVFFNVQNSSSLAIASCRSSSDTFGISFISVRNNSKARVVKTEVKFAKVLHGSSNYDVKFTDCTFIGNTKLIETEGGTISIKGSTITELSIQVNSISLSKHSYLHLENTTITNEFLVAEGKSYFRMTNCSFRMNYFRTHFLIKNDSSIVVVDSVISENIFISPILNIVRSTCFLEGTSLDYNKLYEWDPISTPLVNLSVHPEGSLENTDKND